MLKLDFSPCVEHFTIVFKDGSQRAIDTASHACIMDICRKYDHNGHKFEVFVQRGTRNIKIGSNM